MRWAWTATPCRTGQPRTAVARAPGIATSLLLDGEWNVDLGDTLRASASLRRSSGDLRILTGDAATAVVVQGSANAPAEGTPAGVRQAELSLHIDNNTLRTRLVWASERAGEIEASVSTPWHCKAMPPASGQPTRRCRASCAPACRCGRVVRPGAARLARARHPGRQRHPVGHPQRPAGQAPWAPMPWPCAPSSMGSTCGTGGCALRWAATGSTSPVSTERRARQPGTHRRAQWQPHGGTHRRRHVKRHRPIRWGPKPTTCRASPWTSRPRPGPAGAGARRPPAQRVGPGTGAMATGPDRPARATDGRPRHHHPARRIGPSLGSDVVVRSAATDRAQAGQPPRPVPGQTANHPTLRSPLNPGKDFALSGHGITTRLTGEIDLQSSTTPGARPASPAKCKSSKAATAPGARCWMWKPA